MEATLNALGGILLNAIPTFLLIILLHFYLKATFFKPMEKVLHEREEATTGARKNAEAALARAEQKTREYEDALRAARNEIYKEQEQMRRQWQQEQDKLVAGAQARARELVASATRQIEVEAAAAKQTLTEDSRALAAQITKIILERRPA